MEFMNNVFQTLKLSLGVALVVFGLVLPSKTFASLHPWRDEDSRPGYSEEVDQEKEGTGEILYSFDDPYKNEIRFSDKVFDPTLKKDITTRYQERFGRTEAEIIQSRTPYLNSNFSEGASITFNEEEYQKQQKSFGNYVAKRVVEYHFEKETKNNPDLRGVYEAKQTLENASASVGKFKIRAKYRISSNSIIAYVRNPYVDVEARFEMSGEKETVYSMSKHLPKGYSVVTDYYIENERWDLIGRKSLTDRLSVSISYSPFRTILIDDGGTTVEFREEIGIAGLSYVF